MKLEQLYPNFLSLSETDQLSFVDSYRARRHKDLVETTVVDIKQKGKRKSVGRKVTITPEAFELLKKIGLI